MSHKEKTNKERRKQLVNKIIEKDGGAAYKEPNKKEKK